MEKIAFQGLKFSNVFGGACPRTPLDDCMSSAGGLLCPISLIFKTESWKVWLKASFDKAAPRTKKQLTKADINTPSTTNPRRQPNAKTDSETTFSGTTSIQQGRQQQHRTQIPQPN